MKFQVKLGPMAKQAADIQPLWARASFLPQLMPEAPVTFLCESRRGTLSRLPKPSRALPEMHRQFILFAHTQATTDNPQSRQGAPQRIRIPLAHLAVGVRRSLASGGDWTGRSPAP